MVMWAPTWGWIVLANVLPGVNQGLTWSTTVIMKIDLAGPRRRGLAMGLNEAAGYGAVAVTALTTGFIAEHAGLRPAPFFLGLAYAALGLGLSTLAVRETRGHADLEAAARATAGEEVGQEPSPRRVFVLTSFREPALSSCSQAGMVNNLNDGMAWRLFPLLFARGGLSVAAIGTLAATYPRGVGARAAADRRHVRSARAQVDDRRRDVGPGGGDRAGRRGHRVRRVGGRIGALGAGTAMVYPTLLAAIGDVAHPAWRASAVGVYRLWRDAGYAVGAVVARVLADAFGATTAIWMVAVLTAASGCLVAGRMYETHRPTGAGRRLAVAEASGDSTAAGASGREA